jgi:acyl-coenzyme A synthetase/AMP-(fatty) acid ligase
VGVALPGGAGEVPKAFIVLNEGQQTSLEELASFVADRLAPYKMIQEVQFVDRLPRGPSGKLLRRALIGEAPDREPS